MQDNIVEIIVNEVIRRIKILLNTHRGLLILAENTDLEILGILLDSMKSQGFVFDCIPALDKADYLLENECFKDMKILEAMGKENTDSDFKDIAEEYEVLIVSNLNLREISKIRDLKIENEFLSLIYEGLKQGKSVYALSKDFEVNASNKGLVKKLRSLISQLEEIGIKVVARLNQGGAVIDKNLITIADINMVEEGSIILKKSAVLTSGARDYLKENGIEILRR